MLRRFKSYNCQVGQEQSMNGGGSRAGGDREGGFGNDIVGKDDTNDVVITVSSGK